MNNLSLLCFIKCYISLYFLIIYNFQRMMLFLIKFSYHSSEILKSGMIYQESQNSEVLKPSLKVDNLPHRILSSYLFICLWILMKHLWALYEGFQRNVKGKMWHAQRKNFLCFLGADIFLKCLLEIQHH